MILPTPEEVARIVWSASTREQAADDIRADRLRVLDAFTERWLTTQEPELTILRNLRREIEQP